MSPASQWDAIVPKFHFQPRMSALRSSPVRPAKSRATIQLVEDDGLFVVTGHSARPHMGRRHCSGVMIGWLRSPPAKECYGRSARVAVGKWSASTATAAEAEMVLERGYMRRVSRTETDVRHTFDAAGVIAEVWRERQAREARAIDATPVSRLPQRAGSNRAGSCPGPRSQVALVRRGSGVLGTGIIRVRGVTSSLRRCRIAARSADGSRAYQAVTATSSAPPLDISRDRAIR